MFVFGDNDVLKGTGGQAVIRGQQNAYGIPTKKFPSYAPRSYYSDHEFDQNVQKIMRAIEQIIIDSPSHGRIYFPSDGLGTGLANLDKCAPRTLAFLNGIIDTIFGIDYS